MLYAYHNYDCVSTETIRPGNQVFFHAHSTPAITDFKRRRLLNF